MISFEEWWDIWIVERQNTPSARNAARAAWEAALKAKACWPSEAESESVNACRTIVAWCDKNDWGMVPKKLEQQMRSACGRSEE